MPPLFAVVCRYPAINLDRTLRRLQDFEHYSGRPDLQIGRAHV